MKLFVDDRRAAPDNTWTVCRSYEAVALLFLSDVPVEELSLDHDMGECDECKNSFPPRAYPLVSDTCRHLMNGHAFVLWMALNDKWPKKRPRVHSENSSGRVVMEEVIERYFSKE